MILPQSFYLRDDVLKISKELLGKVLVTKIDWVITSGKIVEVEAYAWVWDKASHAFGWRNTVRTAPMFGIWWMTYVYLIYGIHHLLNVVTNDHGTPHAVLIRWIEPIEWIDIMMKRRNKKTYDTTLTAWPWALAQALGIHIRHTNLSLQWPEIRIEDRGEHIDPSWIVAWSRVGVAYAWEDAKLPYRFWIKNNPFVSKAKGL